MTKLILEICQNHKGSLTLLEEMVHSASDIGAKYLKIQDIHSSELTHRKKFDKGKIKKGKVLVIKRPYISEFERLKDLDMNAEFVSNFIDICKKYKCLPIVTPFTFNSFERLSNKKLKFIKIASYDCSSVNFLKKIRKLNIPMIVSTGATTQKEINSAKKVLGKALHAFLHCVTIYPTPLEKCNLIKIKELKEIHDVVGWSDHTHFQKTKHTAAFAASMIGADFIERHYTILNKANTKDGPVSINPKEAKELMSFFKLTKKEKFEVLNKKYKDWNKCLGTGSFSLSHEEKLNRDYYRGRFAKKVNKKLIYNWNKDFV